MVRLGAKGIQSEDDLQGNMKPLPGRYHAVVKSVDDTFEKVDKVIIGFEVITGTTPGQAGREISVFIRTNETETPRLTRFALVTGLLRPGEPEREVLFDEAVGKHLVIEVEENNYTNRDGKEVNTVQVSWFGFWSLGNNQVSDVPKDMAAVKGSFDSFVMEPDTEESKAAEIAADDWSDV